MGGLDSPGAPKAGTPLCSLAEISDPGSKGFEFGVEAERFSLFLVRKEGEIFAYRNTCPHAGHPLDFPKDRFLTLDNKAIKCASHGALFEPATGLCFDGPCQGRKLMPIAVHVVGEQIFIGEATDG